MLIELVWALFLDDECVSIDNGMVDEESATSSIGSICKNPN
jgi:hypothetical protein